MDTNRINPYRFDSIYWHIFEHLRSKASGVAALSKGAIIQFAVDNLVDKNGAPMTAAKASAAVNIVISPRKEHVGNLNGSGGTYYMEARKLAGKRDKVYSLRWREVPMSELKREYVPVQHPEGWVAKKRGRPANPEVQERNAKREARLVLKRANTAKKKAEKAARSAAYQSRRAAAAENKAVKLAAKEQKAGKVAAPAAPAAPADVTA